VPKTCEGLCSVVIALSICKSLQIAAPEPKGSCYRSLLGLSVENRPYRSKPPSEFDECYRDVLPIETIAHRLADWITSLVKMPFSRRFAYVLLQSFRPDSPLQLLPRAAVAERSPCTA
jgi:hypothetical protein